MVNSVKEVKLPRINDSEDESVIVFWHKSEGDPVQKGETLVEVQTEKAVTEIAAETDGILTKIHIPRGDVAHVGDVLGTIEEEGTAGVAPADEAASQPSEALPEEGASAKKEFVKASPRVRKLAKELGVELAEVKGTGKNGQPTIEDVQKAAEHGEKDLAAESGPRIIASPSVRKLARELGVNLEEIQRSGVNGRIHREDVRKYADEKKELVGQPESPQIDVHDEAIERVKLKGIRKAMSKAMSHSKQTIPHVTHFGEAEVTDLVTHREKYKELAAAKQIKLTYMPYIIKALVSALKEFKELNASIDEEKDEILYKNFYNIGFAVQTDNGLVVPVIKQADQLTIPELAKEIEILSKAARENRLTPSQIENGTCTISNIGSAKGEWFTPIIRHPETAILGVGQIVEKPIVQKGEITIGKMMALSLSYDHRIIDGVIAQKALNEIKTLLQDPELLILDLQ